MLMKRKMYNTAVFRLTVLSCLLSACREAPSEYSLFPAPTDNTADIRIDSLDYEILPLDTIHTSFLGDLYINNDKLQWVDYRFCWIFEFDPAGRFLQRRLGQGKSLKEIPTGLIYSYAPDGKGGFTVIGPQTDCYVFDSTYTLQNQFLVQDYVVDEDPGESDPDKAGTYTYAYDKLVTRAYDDELYINIYSESDDFNFFGDAVPYFREAPLLMGVNLKNARADRLLGRFSPAYVPNSYLCKLFVYTGFDIARNGDFYMAMEADSLIYQYDRDYRPIRSFGRAGRGMDCSYPVLRNLDEIQAHYADGRAMGHYDWIEYIDRTGLLFRSYVKSAEAEVYGLQIYDGTVLVADVDVPVGFRVKGYIAPYYYAVGRIDEENEKIPVYRFKLD